MVVIVTVLNVLDKMVAATALAKKMVSGNWPGMGMGAVYPDPEATALTAAAGYASYSRCSGHPGYTGCWLR